LRPPEAGGPDEERQLSLIREFSQIAESVQIPFWLRGGWAMDFFLGRVTRPHEDIDLFVWAADSARLVEALTAHGFVEVEGPPPERQRNFLREGVEFHITLLERAPSGEVFTASAPSEWGPWPADMLGTITGSVEGVTCPIVSPESQLEVKRKFREWRPDRPEREKDRADIELLEAALRSPLRPSECRD
jgi:Aminoglycoside-2''-adenylyltransferase